MSRPDSSDHASWRTGGSLKIGDPLDEKTDIGTIINDKQFTKVCRYVDEGLKRSDARLMFGGYARSRAVDEIEIWRGLARQWR
jgi:acyl-CoA reductase-like NAD-dependent aldehyde dehydrogenase